MLLWDTSQLHYLIFIKKFYSLIFRLKPEEQLGYFLKDCRSRSGLNRGKVADILGVNVSVINQIEHGSISSLVRNIIERLIKVIIENGNRKERSKAFNLLNEILPKSRTRYKFDSKRGRRQKLTRSKQLKRSMKR